MPKNDESDSLSVRGGDDPRRPLRALEDETEHELLHAERGDEAAEPDDAASTSDREARPRDPRGGQPADASVHPQPLPEPEDRGPRRGGRG